MESFATDDPHWSLAPQAVQVPWKGKVTIWGGRVVAEETIVRRTAVVVRPAVPACIECWLDRFATRAAGPYAHENSPEA